jgi:spoIIIJ-associated protein
MNDKNDANKAKKVAEDLIRKIAPEARISVLPIKEATIYVEAQVDDPQTLIGQGGETLLAIQHLLRVILRKSSQEPCYIDLDINDYKKTRNQYLKELALTTANQVALAKREVALAPMSSYERRIVHMELKPREDVVTESRGEGVERKVVVKPAANS